jgi:hypothetical protein
MRIDDRAVIANGGERANIIRIYFSCILAEILIRVRECDCAAYGGQFRKHYFICSEKLPDDGTH